MSKYICSNCKEIIGTDKDKIENFLLNILGGGLTIISVIIYLALLIISIILIFTPLSILGIIFTIVLLFKRFSFGKSKSEQNFCPNCKAKNTLVPCNTPYGKTLYSEFYQEKDVMD